ncbi:BatA domain-containing protein [uncultured Imperialibacter sp.]|uniref:BatA domain-containing protein n=1 Tax=uncultured Imperialibacter sp. TaxID=1672639 RepID=UPI0030D87A04|tara:strand:- start:1562 stop:2773 length:1212 start_codon:yes stop_codon:yes gene_type:complete
MMQLANPMWLWGLLGLAVPLAIHLLSRKEGKVIKVGSLRHLADSTTRQFQSVKLNELLLLALRSVLILTVVALLAGLLLRSSASLPKWVVVDRGAEQHNEIGRIIDSLTNNDYELRYLEQWFPLPKDTISEEQTPNHWFLAEQLGEAKISEAVVFTRAYMYGFKGKRPPKPDHIMWFDVPFKPVSLPVVSVVEGDSIWEVSEQPDEEFTEFTTRSADAKGSITVEIPIEKVVIVSDEEHSYDAKVLETALLVLNDLPGFRMDIQSESATFFSANEEAVVFWLASAAAPALENDFVFMEEATSDDLLVQLSPRQWQLTKRLNKRVVLEDRLIVELSKFFDTELPLMAESDRRTMPEAWRWSKVVPAEVDVDNKTTNYADINQWLVVLLVLTLVIERLVAWRRGQ